MSASTLIAGVRDSPTRRLTVAICIAGALLLPGCGSERSDKAGGEPPTEALVLTMANGSGSAHELEAFASAVARESGGTLRVAVRNAWRSGQRDAEQGMLADVRSGKADLGWAGTRAFADAGLNAFDALHAPLLVDSYRLQERVLASPLAERMLDRLSGLGVVGITILPGPMRKPLGVSPLVGPADYDGKTIAMARSAVAVTAFEALGAVGRAIAVGGPIDGLDGVEQQPESILASGYDGVGKFLTANVNLWPRPLVVFMNRAALDNLEDQQRAALIRAGRVAVPSTADGQAAADAETAEILCNRGLAFVDAGREDLAGLRGAFKPVFSELERDRFTRRALTEISNLKAEIGAPPEVPRCKNAGSTAIVRKRTPIDGHYRMKSTAADLRKLGAAEADVHSDNYGVWETVLDRGRFRQEQPNDAGAEGTYTVDGDLVTFTVTAGKPGRFTETRPGEVYAFRWSRYRDFLRLAAGPDDNSPPTWFVKPWRRLGDAP